MGDVLARTSRCRLSCSPDCGTWTWEVEGVQCVAAARTAVLAEPDPGFVLASCERASVSDAIGRGESVEFRYASARGFALFVRLALYEGAPILAIDAEITNGSDRDVSLAEIVFLEGALDLGASPLSYSVRGTGYWMGNGGLSFADQEVKTSWLAAIANRTSGVSLVAGIAEPANVDDAISLHRQGREHRLRFTGECASNRRGRPLLLRPATAFRANRIVLVRSDDVHDALRRYTEFLGRGAALPIPKGPCAGLFTAYSSDPENHTVLRLTEGKVGEQIAVLERTLAEFGVEYVKIEFGVCGSPGLLDPKLAAIHEPPYLQPREYRLESYFPRGIRALTDEIHRRGLKAAWQLRTFLQAPGGAPGGDEAAAAICRRAVEEWGFDYLMLDFNSADADNADETRTIAEVLRDRFRAIRAAVGDQVFIEGCMMAIGPAIGSVDGFRPAADFRGGEEDRLLVDFASYAPFHGRVAHMDIEFYDASAHPFVWNAVPVATPVEGARSWISLCALLGFSFFLGGDLAGTSEERLHLLSRALPVLGPCAQAVDLMREALPRTWVLEPGDRSCAERVVGLFNWSYDREEQAEITLAGCGFSDGAPVLVFDFWARRLLGEHRAAITAHLRPRTCRVLFLSRVPDHPAIIGTDRHVTGAFGQEGFRWDEGTRTFFARSRGPRGTAHSLFVYLPLPQGPRACRGCRADLVERNLVEVRVSFADGSPVEWSVELDADALVR